MKPQNQDGFITLTDVAEVLERPHVRDFEQKIGVDYLDLVRPAFSAKGGAGSMGFEEFHDLLLSSDKIRAGSGLSGLSESS